MTSLAKLRRHFVVFFVCVPLAMTSRPKGDNSGFGASFDPMGLGRFVDWRSVYQKRGLDGKLLGGNASPGDIPAPNKKQFNYNGHAFGNNPFKNSQLQDWSSIDKRQFNLNAHSFGNNPFQKPNMQDWSSFNKRQFNFANHHFGNDPFKNSQLQNWSNKKKRQFKFGSHQFGYNPFKNSGLQNWSLFKRYGSGI